MTSKAAKVIEITSKNLPLSCPLPSDTLWNAHPTVYLAIEKTGEVQCYYCSTTYRLKETYDQ